MFTYKLVRKLYFAIDKKINKSHAKKKVTEMLVLS